MAPLARRKIGRTCALAVLGALAFAVGAGCAALPTPSPADAVRAQRRWSEASVDSLARGRELYVRRCAGCHNLPLPESRSEEAWIKVMDEMAEEAKLSPDERVLVERFLLTMRDRPPAP